MANGMKSEMLLDSTSYHQHRSGSVLNSCRRAGRFLLYIVCKSIDVIKKYDADRRTLKTLQSLDDRMLKDIGMTREDVGYGANDFPLYYGNCKNSSQRVMRTQLMQRGW